MIDGEGVHGFILHYTFLFALFASALLAFIYFWVKRGLDFDEEIKYQPFEEE